MRILAMVQGTYGNRIIEHLKLYLPQGWIVETMTVSPVLPLLIDEPEEFLPPEVASAELLLALIESEGAAQLIPALARLCSARAVIVPVDNPAWLPLGLQNQIRQELESKGMNAVFPRTFCTLTESGAGFRHHAESYSDEFITAFARHFGKPKLKLTVDPKEGRITAVEVKRCSPCGSTRHAAEKLVGMSVAEAVPLAGLIVHQFPCLASMQKEEMDDGIFEPLMNISGYVINDEIERALKINWQVI